MLATGFTYRYDAVAAAADLGVVEDEVHHLREGERDHDEVDAARAQRKRADDERIAARSPRPQSAARSTALVAAYLSGAASTTT